MGCTSSSPAAAASAAASAAEETDDEEDYGRGGFFYRTLLRRFQGDFDNYVQVRRDHAGGLTPREGGGHEHIHCSLVPVDASLVRGRLGDEDGRVAVEGEGANGEEEEEEDHDDDDDDEDEDSSSSISGDEIEGAAAPASDEVDHLLASERGGLPCLLPDDVLDRVFSHLDVHSYAAAALVSPHWRSFTRTEHVYRTVCRRAYLNQSKRKALHPHRFGGSYRTMLERRPRVRTGGGLYALKYAKVKKIQRDMWTEIPVGAILESVYYRYMYFHESGRVLYNLTASPPTEVLPRFARILAGTEEERDRGSGCVWGRYEVRKRDVTVWASHPWHDVRMELRIMDDDEAKSNHCGKNCGMAFVRHASSASGDFDEWTSRDLVEYEVPSEPFRYLPDRRL
uniref:F-box domain-containing protein n=1 Tax=Trieres chinensis TaxID=1514140 RepID=A0A7S1ZWM5_TRICV|mmetsp:Transcript_34700/g.70849  ORF Transcript_34700/g.70849 Transcript_34700/m.70849 type:complete len:396 (+) Transcript_34700:287-1474(+)